MEVNQIIIGGVIAIISYFLKGVMQENKSMREDINTNKVDISLLKQGASNIEKSFTEKFGMLMQELKEMREDIKHLNK